MNTKGKEPTLRIAPAQNQTHELLPEELKRLGAFYSLLITIDQRERRKEAKCKQQIAAAIGEAQDQTPIKRN